jgi:hypothetical protein
LSVILAEAGIYALMKIFLNIFFKSDDGRPESMDSGLGQDDRQVKQVIRLVVPLVSAIALLLPALALAQATLSISGSLPGVSAGATNPGAWINGFYTLALMFGGVLAFGAVVYGGVLYAASAGNPSRQTEGKEWIWAALTGLLLLAGAWLVLNTINPALTNISFPTLSGLSSTGTGGGGGNGGGTGGPSAVLGVNGNVAGLLPETITALNDLEHACGNRSGGGCSINVTSGVGGNHAAGVCDHASGCKADIQPLLSVDLYITSLPRANPQTRSDGAPLYQAPDGAIFADERVKPPLCVTNCQWTGAHWDMSAHK